MVTFVSWFQRYRVSILMAILLGTGWTTLWVLDHSAQDLIQMRKIHDHNRESLVLWNNYRIAVRERSPLVYLFKRYRYIPLWNRIKIREALVRLTEIHGLRLRDYQFMDQSSSEGSSKGIKCHPIRISVGASTDSQISDFIDDLNTNLAPWVKAHKALLQRCGSVEDVSEEETDEGEKEEDTQEPPNDVVEARIELDWLLTLEESKNEKK